MTLDGDTVYRSLMDLDLLLQDGDKMIELKFFLGTVDPSSPSLAKLHAEILAFTGRIERLVAASASVDLATLGVQGPPPSKTKPATKRIYAAPIDADRIRSRVHAETVQARKRRSKR